MATPYWNRDQKPKFDTHVDEHRVIMPINFREHRSMASYILKTIRLN